MCNNLLSAASILHLSAGLHKLWDGLKKYMNMKHLEAALEEASIAS